MNTGTIIARLNNGRETKDVEDVDRYVENLKNLVQENPVIYRQIVETATSSNPEKRSLYDDVVLCSRDEKNNTVVDPIETTFIRFDRNSIDAHASTSSHFRK